MAGNQASKGILQSGFYSKVHAKTLYEDDGLQQPASNPSPPWWRYAQEITNPIAFRRRSETAALALSEPSQVWLLPVRFGACDAEALVDTVASWCFMLASFALEVLIPMVNLGHGVSSRVASGETLELRGAAGNVAFTVGEAWQYETSATFLVTNLPYRVTLGADSLWEEMATWDLRRKTLIVGAGKRKNTLNLEGCQTAHYEGPKDVDRQIWIRNHMEGADEIQRTGPQEAKALVLPTSKQLQELQDQAQKDTHYRTPQKAATTKVVCSYEHLLCDKLPPVSPPSRLVDHTITLLPGQMPRKGAVYRVGGEELEAQLNSTGAKGEQMDKFDFF
ncbi:hypothetical protein Efla_007745 [Eimeria flavescens]